MCFNQFVLKHDIFRDLREIDYCLGTLNPHCDQGVKLVQEMLRQVMELHPKSTRLHIGADEVQSNSVLKKNQSIKDFFINSYHYTFDPEVSSVQFSSCNDV